MKFGKHFESHLTPEWRKQYLSYSTLKDMISRGVEEAPIRSEVTEQTLKLYYNEFGLEFFTECDRELQKVNNFFLEKLAENKRKHVILKTQLMSLVEPHSRRRSSENTKHPKKNHLRYAYSEFYLSLILLQNYQALNHTGFVKICKKYDKNFHSNEGFLWLKNKVEFAPFCKNTSLNIIIQEVEDLYIVHLAGGDRALAMTKLRVPPLGEATKPFLVFRAGFSLGMFLILFIVTMISYDDDPILHQPLLALIDYAWSPRAEYSDVFINLYRGPFTWCIFMFFMAFNIAGFQYYGINYILIFEIDPRNHLQPANYLEYASMYGIMWSLSSLGFMYNEALNVDPFIFPFLLTVVTFCFLINPFPIMSFQSRFWLVRLVGRVITAPFHYVGFADFWLGDQMNSLVVCMSDYYFLLLFYIKYWTQDCDPKECMHHDYFVIIARCLPAWFRFAQCLRRYFEGNSKAVSYLINAGKYSTSFFVAFFLTLMTLTEAYYQNVLNNPYTWGFLISSLVSTIYCLLWDNIRDFGLFKVFSGSKIFLRNNLVYPKTFYYFVIIENAVIRFFWIADFYISFYTSFHRYTIKSCGSVLEMFRRFIWNFFRLENEHLNNCGRFRETRDIYLERISIKDGELLNKRFDDDEDKSDSRASKSGIPKKYF